MLYIQHNYILINFSLILKTQIPKAESASDAKRPTRKAQMREMDEKALLI